jgi:sugar-specific transcriptional regulator TrmB
VYDARVRHKTNFVVCFLNADETSRLETYPINESGINRFTAQLAAEDEVAVEVTANIYSFYDRIKAHVSRIVLVDTYRFSVIAKSKKKTDKADARALAQFLKLDHLPSMFSPLAYSKMRSKRNEPRQPITH